MSRLVVGLDLSLTATGVATIANGIAETRTLKPAPKMLAHERLAWVVQEVWEYAGRFQFDLVDLVVVEGPSYGNQGSGRQSGHHERAGLWWLMTHTLWEHGSYTAVVPPAALKKYATGKGSAGKDAVLLATARRFPNFAGDNNEADALWLAAMGADHLGEPVVAMPAAHRAALDAVKWPDMGEANE